MKLTHDRPKSAFERIANFAGKTAGHTFTRKEWEECSLDRARDLIRWTKDFERRQDFDDALSNLSWLIESKAVLALQWISRRFSVK